jgi:hypothetical protein
VLCCGIAGGANQAGKNYPAIFKSVPGEVISNLAVCRIIYPNIIIFLNKFIIKF